MTLTGLPLLIVSVLRQTVVEFVTYKLYIIICDSVDIFLQLIPFRWGGVNLLFSTKSSCIVITNDVILVPSYGYHDNSVNCVSHVDTYTVHIGEKR